jgi:hypothetical protein
MVQCKNIRLMFVGGAVLFVCFQLVRLIFARGWCFDILKSFVCSRPIFMFRLFQLQARNSETPFFLLEQQSQNRKCLNRNLENAK